MKNKKSISILLSFFMMLSITLSCSDKVKADENFKLSVTNVVGENYNKLNWTNLGKGYTYRVYQKGQDDAVYQTIPTKKSVRTLNVYPDYNNEYNKVSNTGKSGGQIDLDGKSVPDSGILKTWLLKENINDVTIDCVSLSSFNTNPSKYLKKIDGKWNYDSVFYGMWNLEPDIVYPSDLAIDYLKEYIDEGQGFMTSHHTIGYSGLDRGINKLAKDMGVEIFANNTQLSRDSNGNKYSTVSFECLEKGLNTWQSSYWPSGNKVKIVKNGLLINYPFKVGNVGDVIDIEPMHGLSVFGTGDVWMNVVDPAAHNCDESMKFREINKSPTTGKEGTNNFYVHTYNNTAIINSGHSFPKITTAETRIIANTLYYLSQVTEENYCDDHKGQDVTAPDKPTIKSVNVTNGINKKVNINLNEVDDKGTKYNYFVKATEEGTNRIIKSNEVSTEVKSGFKGYSIVVDQNENTVPENKVITESTNYTIDAQYDSDFYVHVAAVDNAGNVSEVSTYKYVYPILNLTAGDLNTDNNTVTIKAEAKVTDKTIKSITLPDGTVVEGSNAEFTVDVNGTYIFKAVDNEGNEVSNEIRISNIPGKVTLDDVKVNEDNASTTLNWSISDKTQDYSYNVNSKKSDETEFKSESVNGTTYVDNNAKDVALPEKSEIKSVTTNREDKTTLISFSESTDNGTSYDYYVDGTGLNSGLTSKSETKSATVTSGIKGYSIVVDQNEDTIPDGTITTTSTDYTFDKLYDTDFYVHVAAVDNAGNMSEVSTFKYAYPALKLTPNTTEVVKDTVTITAEASCEGNSIVKIITPDGKEVDGDKAQYTVDVNGAYTFKAIDSKGDEVTESIEITNIVPDVILNVESNMNRVHLEENFVVDLTIDHVTNIGAVDVRLKYDDSKLKLLSIDKTPGVIFFTQKESNDVLRFTFVSLGDSNFINNKQTLLKLNFTGTAAGDALIDIIPSVVTSEKHPERFLRDAECGETTINICDRKLRTDITLADLAMIGKHLGEDPEKLLPDIDVDFNLDGKIDEADIEKAYNIMINNPNYKYNAA